MLDPLVRPIPSSDADFVRAAENALARLLAAGWADDRLGPGLATELRDRYPTVVVRQMDRLAAIVENRVVWYVFRDGDGHDEVPASKRAGT